VSAAEQIAEDLERWIRAGDELALARVQVALVAAMYAPSTAIDALGLQAVEDVRGEVVAKLLSGGATKLRGADNPLAYARRAWRNALTSELRKWGPRQRRESEVRQHEQLRHSEPSHRRAEVHMDAERALAIAGSLTGKGRLAVLLLVRPDRIAEEDWQLLIEDLPPPPPERPDEPVDKETASRWLYPPRGLETAAQRRQRLNSFDKAWKRAIARIREQLETP